MKGMTKQIKSVNSRGAKKPKSLKIYKITGAKLLLYYVKWWMAEGGVFRGWEELRKEVSGSVHVLAFPVMFFTVIVSCKHLGITSLTSYRWALSNSTSPQ